MLFLHATLLYRTCAAAGDAAAADARSGRKTVDLDGLSFAQGGHLNTNKNTNLPPGSTRTTDKVHLVFVDHLPAASLLMYAYSLRRRLFKVQ
jgi:hypothetical protein